MPRAHLPLIRQWIDHLAGTMHVVRLVARGGVGDLRTVVEHETIAIARACIGRHQFEPACFTRPHFAACRESVDFDAHSPLPRCPDSEAHSVGRHRGAARNSVATLAELGRCTHHSWDQRPSRNSLSRTGTAMRGRPCNRGLCFSTRLPVGVTHGCHTENVRQCTEGPCFSLVAAACRQHLTGHRS